MCGKPGKGRHGTSHHAKAIYQIFLKSFLPVEAEITVTKVFITANMKNSKLHCNSYIVAVSLAF
jgi:hypothetical protein